MITVHLSQLRFFAHHGVFDGEAATGGGFELDLDVSYEEKNNPIRHLKEVIDYGALFSLVKQQMYRPSPLLEEVAQEIINSVLASWPYIGEIKISLYKLQPPIENFQGKAGITIHRKFLQP